MIFPDVNVLLYAHDETSHFHKAASSWLRRVLAEEEVFFSWQTITGFIRISTNPRLLAHPFTIEQAVEAVQLWLDLENTHIVNLRKQEWPVFARILCDGQATGNLVMDGHIAAMAVACGALVASTDRDLTRFPGIRLINPLEAT